MALFQEGEDVMVARETFPLAFARFVSTAVVFGVLSVVMWQAGIFADENRPDAWIVPGVAVLVLLATPFATTLREARFDRRTRVLTAIHANYMRRDEKKYHFAKIVEVRSTYQSGQTWNGYYVEVQFESWRTLRLNSGLAEQPVTLEWTRRLHDFLGGRSTGEDPSTVHAFTVGR
jgi:hypothetical protein